MRRFIAIGYSPGERAGANLRGGSQMVKALRTSQPKYTEGVPQASANVRSYNRICLQVRPLPASQVVLIW